MAVDFGLLGGAQVPMSVKPFKPVDAVGNTEAAYNLAGEMTDVSEKIRQQRQSQADRQILQEAMKSEDFSTGEGLDKALKSLQGKLSPEGFTNLANYATKVKSTEAKIKSELVNTSMDEQKLFLQQTEMAAPAIGQFLQTYQQIKQAKGEQEAQRMYQEGLPMLVQHLSQQQIAPGKPLMPPNVAQHFAQMNPDQLQEFYQGSMHRKQIVEQNFKEAQTKELEERTKKEQAQREEIERGGKGNWKVYTDGTDKYEYDTKSGRWKKNGDEIDVKDVPSKVASLGSRDAIVGSTGDIDFEKKPPTDWERTEAKKYILTNRMPQLGTGAKASESRMRILAIAAQEAENMGLSPDDTIKLQNKIKAATESTKRLLTQSSQIRAGEENVKKVLDIVEDEVKKLGGPNSPKIRQFWNKSMTEWAGDPEFVGINQAYLDLTENMARIYSGVTGAAGTPVSFLELAKNSLPSNPNLGQVLRLKEIVPKLFDARLKATEDQLKEVTNIATLPKSSGASSGEKVTPEEQKARDTDAGQVLTDEHKKLVSQLSGLTGEDRKRKLDDIKALRREMQSKKIPLPAFDESSQESAPKVEERSLKSGKKVKITVVE